MKPRLLVLTAGYGEGHNAAARALAAACRTAHGEDSVRVVDPFEIAAPRLNAVVRRGYLELINRSPRAWSWIYGWVDRSVLLPRFMGVFRREMRIIESIIREFEPTAIGSTYPVYGFLLERIARRTGLATPHFNVVTDSISINSLWWRSACTRWFLPNDDSAVVLRAAGIEASALSVLGFPVAPFFSEHAGRLYPPDLHTDAAPRVLYIVNSRRERAADCARLLLAQTDWEVTIAVGRNEPLRVQLEALARNRAKPARILGWTDQIPQLLMTHHVVVSKAGGATTQEALAARCPMVVNEIVPGQEEGNYELLHRHGIGTLAETPEAMIAALTHAFAWNGSVWRQWRRSLEPLARPDAAREIVGRVFQSGALETSRASTCGRLDGETRRPQADALLPAKP